MYAYRDPNREAHLNLKEAAQEAWRGLTAYVQGQPYLVIDKEGSTYTLEGEDGSTLKLQQFEWEPGSDYNKLVAASRLEESPLAEGRSFDGIFMGKLAFEDGRWEVLTDDGSAVVPIDEFVEHLASTNWIKVADDETHLWLLLNDGSLIHAPASEVQSHPQLAYSKFGSDPNYADIYSDPYTAMGELRNGQVHLSSLLPPDYSGNGPKRWEAIKVGRQVRNALRAEGIPAAMTMTASAPGGDVSFPLYWNEHIRQVQNPENVRAASGEQISLPPAGIGGHTNMHFAQNGYHAKLQLPPTSAYPEGAVVEIPGPMRDYTPWQFNHWDDNGGIVDMSTVPVSLLESSHSPEEIQQALLDAEEMRGRRGHVEEEYEAVTQAIIAAHEDGLACPSCGSHSLRALHVDNTSRADMKCLTCGNEFGHDVTKNYTDHKSKQSDFEESRMGSLWKGSPYPSDSYKNAPDHTPKGQKEWPAEVNAVYNACMRDGKGRGDSKDEKESSCAAIAWAQYKKTQKKDSATTAAHTPGTRVECVHPSMKGQRGSVLKHKGTDSATGEDTYDVLYDNGEKGEGLRHSDLKHIKSANFNSDEHFLETVPILPKEAYGAPSGQPFMPPGQSGGYPMNPAGMQSYPGYSNDTQTEECPQCHSNRTTVANMTDGHPLYRCLDCGTVFDGKQPMQASVKFAWNDVNGNPMTAGSWYVMHSPKYKVPDVFQVLNLEDDRLEGMIEGDEDYHFPLHISSDEIESNGYSFEPYTEQEEQLREHTADVSPDPNMRAQEILDRVRELMAQGATQDEVKAVMDQYYAILDGQQEQAEQMQQQAPAPNQMPGQMLTHREARKSFTPTQQRDLINENMGGRARNIDKLNLEGTHYESQVKEEDDPFFLWL